MTNMQNTQIDRSMRRTFDEIALTELKQLWQTGEWTKSALAVKFNCSVTTVCLWLTEEIIRQAKIKSKTRHKAGGGCDCGQSYATHDKCSICKIHVHGQFLTDQLPTYYKYGLRTQSTGLCDECFKKYRAKDVELVGFYKIGPDYRQYRIIANPYTQEVKLLTNA